MIQDTRGKKKTEPERLPHDHPYASVVTQQYFPPTSHNSSTPTIKKLTRLQIRYYLIFFNLLELCVLYIGRAYRYPPDVAFHIFFFFFTNISTEYFKHAAHSPFFSSKCRLFHNATFFGSCIINILHTACAKIEM
jgi:hypothetical protein